MTSRVTKWRRRRRGMEFVNEEDLSDVLAVTTANDEYMIDQFFHLFSQVFIGYLD